MLHSFVTSGMYGHLDIWGIFFFHIIKGKLRILPMWYTLIIWNYFVVYCMTFTSVVIFFFYDTFISLVIFYDKFLSYFCGFLGVVTLKSPGGIFPCKSFFLFVNKSPCQFIFRYILVNWWFVGAFTICMQLNLINQLG